MSDEFDQDMMDIEEELGIEGDFEDLAGIGYVEDIGDEDFDYDDDGDDDVGAIRRRRRYPRRRRSTSGRMVRRRPRRSYGRRRIAVPSPGDVGDGVVWLLPCTAAVALAAAATGTLTFTPNRNVSVRGFSLGVYTAAAITRAATYPEAIKLTGINIMGRPQFAGTGEVPLAVLLYSNYQKVDPVMENCTAGQSILITLRNDDAATTHNVTGGLWVTTVK